MSDHPNDSQPRSADTAHRAHGIFRQRPDENGGKEFFHFAQWHNDTIPGDGERVVSGWFVPDDAVGADDARPVASIDLIIRDVCEVDPADPDADNTACIGVDDLRLILERHMDGEVPPRADTDEAEALRAFDKSVADGYMHECGSYTAGYIDCRYATRDTATRAQAPDSAA